MKLGIPNQWCGRAVECRAILDAGSKPGEWWINRVLKANDGIVSY